MQALIRSVCMSKRRPIGNARCISCVELKVQAGVVLNPHTSEDFLRYVLPDLDLVLLMTVNPASAAQKFIRERAAEDPSGAPDDRRGWRQDRARGRRRHRAGHRSEGGRGRRAHARRRQCRLRPTRSSSGDFRRYAPPRGNERCGALSLLAPCSRARCLPAPPSSTPSVVPKRAPARPHCTERCAVEFGQDRARAREVH